jgi:archaellum component FlaC
MDEIKSILHAIVKNQELARAELDSFKVGVTKELGALHARLGGVDSRLDSMDARLDSMDTRLDSMNVRLDGLSGEFNAFRKEHGLQYNELLSNMRKLDRHMTWIEADFEKAMARIDRLEDRSR